jgi:hypothetical protein
MSEKNEKATEKGTEKLEGLAAVLISICTIVGALVAWRAALSEDIAGDADYVGIRSLTWAEESRTIHTVDAYEDYRLFLSYRGNDQLGDLIEASKPKSDSDEELAALERDLEEARQVAEVNVSFLDETKASRYLNRDGSFAFDREMGEKWSAAGRRHDLHSGPRFEEADKYRLKTEKQLTTGVILTIALVLFTLFEAFSGPIRMLFLGLGGVLFAWGTIWAILLERVV